VERPGPDTARGVREAERVEQLRRIARRKHAESEATFKRDQAEFQMGLDVFSSKQRELERLLERGNRRRARLGLPPLTMGDLAVASGATPDAAEAGADVPPAEAPPARRHDDPDALDHGPWLENEPLDLNGNLRRPVEVIFRPEAGKTLMQVVEEAEKINIPSLEEIAEAGNRDPQRK
jgi:hypothetical protein